VGSLAEGRCTAMDIMNMWMGLNIRASSIWIRNKASESIPGRIIALILATGSMGSSTVWASTILRIKSRDMASGSKEKNWPGLTKNRWRKLRREPFSLRKN